jgi:predicted unusual protein kinase regulating ubiquinone biosynthesis (AarF/ABC1/UbiB family)
MGNYKKMVKSDKLNFVLEDCIEHSLEHTREIYYDDYKKEIDDDYILEEIVGSGSIGQVYKAFSKKRNEYIAIKVKHPNINNLVDKTARALRIVCFLFKPINRFHNIFMEYINNIHLQIDYIQEAKNTIKLKENFKNEDRIIIPEVYEYSKNFIFMSYHEGKKYSEVSTKSQLISSMYINFFYQTSLVVHDFLHSDLHFGNWKVIEEENDVKLLIYDCGIVSSSGNLDFNKEVLKNTFNRRNFTKILDIVKRMNPSTSKRIDKYKPEIEKVITFDITAGECMTLFLNKLADYRLIKDKNIINILSSIAIIGDTPIKSVNALTKYLYSDSSTDENIFYTYIGILERINRFHELKNFFIKDVEKHPDYKEKYENWLLKEFGHKNGNILNKIIYDKFYGTE